MFVDRQSGIVGFSGWIMRCVSGGVQRCVSITSATSAFTAECGNLCCLCSLHNTICQQCHSDSVVTDLFRRHQQSHAIQNEDHKEKSMHIYYRDMGGISLNMFSSCDKGTWTDLLAYLYPHSHFGASVVPYGNLRKGFRALARRRRELQQNGHTSDESNKRALERERNMAVTVIIILAIFYITYLPQFIMIHVTRFCSSCEISEDSITFHKVDVISSRFVFLNSALNPFVYAWRMPKYRRALNSCWKAFKEKLRLRSQRVEVEPMFVLSRRNVRAESTVST